MKATMKSDEITQDYLDSIGLTILNICSIQTHPNNVINLYNKQSDLTLSNIRGGIKEFEELYRNLFRTEIKNKL